MFFKNQFKKRKGGVLGFSHIVRVTNFWTLFFMNEEKYLLTYDFKVLYCPSMKLKLSTKELDVKERKFIKYSGNLNIIDCFFEIDVETFNDIVENILNGKFGNELSDSDMDWIQKVEKILKVNKDIYNNDNLMFNYYILKMKLAGFEEGFAVQFAKNYFYNLKKKSELNNLISIEDSINILNNIIASKEIWLGNNIYAYTSLDEEFLRTLFNYKRKLGYKFNFDMLKQDYLNVIQNSFVLYIYEYNKKKSYLVKDKKTILNNEPYKNLLLEIYRRILEGIIKYLVEDGGYSDFANEGSKFIDNLINDMSDTVKLYLGLFEDTLK